MNNVTQPQETVEANVETAQVETPQAETTAAEQQMIKLKYNHEEKDYSIDQVREYAQKGMNYDKVQEKLKALESDPRLSFVESQAKKNNMNVEQYLEAVAKEEERSRINEIANQKGIPEDVAKELYESKKFREDYKKEQQTSKQKAKADKDLDAFVKKHPGIKGEDVPQEVWAAWNNGENGKSLVDAYALHENSVLREKLAKFESGEAVQQQNAANAEASTGSVTGNGDVGALYTRAQVKNMSKSEVNKNYKKVMESMKSWK